MSKKEVRVDQLKLGMYVLELDRPWLGTPFAFQGFPLTAQHQIDEIAKYCKSVFIDVERSTRGHDGRLHAAGPQLVRGDTMYPTASPVEVEVPRAKSVYGACEVAVRSIVERLRSEDRLDVKTLTQAVNDITESVLRNPDAMLLLARVRQKGEHEFSRAVDSSVLMITFGRFLQLTREQVTLLGLAGMLLDVGKLRVPDPILKKTGVLAPAEYEEAKKHVLHAVAILEKERELPREVVGIVLQHHERQDGSGYPKGLKGAEITLYGGIAGIVDTYSALISRRPYAEQESPSNALGKLYKLRGTLFNEALVEQFIQCIGIYPVGSVVELNTGEVGVVIAQNTVRRLQPRVMVVLDRERRPLQPHKILDLLKEPRATADEPYRIRRTLPASTLPMEARDFFL